jgi:peptide/nickel transport system substrate-binding protein
VTQLLKYGTGAAALMLAAALPVTPAHAQSTITVAIAGEAQTFDPMLSTQDIVSQVTQHFVETLFTFDSSWGVAPLLAAEMPEISENGTVYRIPLREGVLFHDGSTMTADDVVASLERWMEVATRGRGIADRVTSVEATGPLEVTISLSAPYSPLLALLAFSNSAAVVYPASIVAETIDTIIGTGPYMLGEHEPDRFLQLVRFDGYNSRSEPSDGHSGARLQIPDEIRFVPVADQSTRVEGLVSGQFDFVPTLPAETLDRITTSTVAEPLLLEPFGWPVWVPNHKQGIMADQRIRQALQAALPIDDMLFAAFGDDDFFLVDAPLFPEGWLWHNEAGIEHFNRNDPEAARALLTEAGYDGSPLRVLTSRQFEFHYQMAEVARMALEAAGFTVQLDVVDWATHGQRRNDPAIWDVYITHSPFLPDPSLTGLWLESAPGGWDNAAKEDAFARFTAETDTAKRQEIFAELQRINFEDVGFIKTGAFNALMGQRAGLDGVPPNPWPFFWNASVE